MHSWPELAHGGQEQQQQQHASKEHHTAADEQGTLRISGTMRSGAVRLPEWEIHT